MDPNRDMWRGFARGMRANPEEDTPRLAFSDWLADEYGEMNPFVLFIRRQIEIAKTSPAHLSHTGWEPADNRHWSLKQECERLLRKTWLAWPPAVGLADVDLRHWRWQRGFPTVVVLSWEKWAAWGDTLCAIGPVGRVVVRTPPESQTLYHDGSGTTEFVLTDAELAKRLRWDRRRRCVLVRTEDIRQSSGGMTLYRDNFLSHCVASAWRDRVRSIRVDTRVNG